jgi:hypothetical protein
MIILNGENQPVVTDCLIEFEKIADRYRGI